MQTEATFENIATRIVNEIKSSKKSVFIAVAWFTNQEIFDVLVQKAQEGCLVFLMVSDDAINSNSSIDLDQVNKKYFKVYKVGDGDRDLMHNKFCVIDHNTVITGSYNWTNKAETNFENIVITYDDTILAEKFISEFNKIKNRYYPEEEEQKKEFPLFKIIKRLEILKNYVFLEEIEELEKGAFKLKEYDFNSDIDTIIRSIEKENFGKALKEIETFITKNQKLNLWTDPEIAALKLEVKNLENQINAFDNEKAELEKVLADFEHRHSHELGLLILEILHLRKELYKDDKQKFEEAQKDEEEYKQQFESEKKKEIFEISEDEKKELKRKFRKATTLCHPDKFINESEAVQKQAEAIFKELNEANAKNDIKRVCEILENLEKGILIANAEEKISDKDVLIATIERLKLRLQQLEAEIQNIKQSETYQTIISIEDWDLYFEETKQKLQYELDELRKLHKERYS